MVPKPVFISYARNASRAHAVGLHAALGPGLAYLDTEELTFGEQFSAALVDALFGAKVIVILAEPVYFTRWYCLLEFRVARTPFLRIAERTSSTRQEKDDALRGIVVALPAGGADPVLERLPPLFRVANWPEIGNSAAIARVVAERLSAGLPTLGERYASLGEADAMREMLLEAMRLPWPRRIGTIPRVPPVGLPASLAERFVGRADDLWRIHDVLTTSSGELSAASLTGSIEAGGGFGKTRLALEYLYRFGTRHFRGGLFWINAEQDVESQHYEVVRALDPDVPPIEVLRAEQGGVAGALARTVRSRRSHEPLLFVIDNVPEPEAGSPPLPLGHWCPVLGEAAVLATSRTRVALGGAGTIVPVEIDTLEPDAAVRFLTMDARREPLSPPEWMGIADWVGYLPLALELLNGLLTSGAMPAGALLAMSRDQRQSTALDSAIEVLRASVPERTLRGITEAFAASYARLTDAERYAARLMAWMSPAVVPDLVLEALEENPFTPAVRATLRGRHFVTAPARSGTLDTPALFGSMHRVLADFLRSRSPRAHDEIGVVLRALGRVMESGSGDERVRLAERVAPAITAAAGHAFAAALPSREAVGALAAINRQLNDLYTRLFDAGAYAWAQVLTETSVRGRRRVLGGEHPDTLTAMNDLAEVLWARDDHAGAREMQERVLAARRRVLGEEHLDTLTTMSNLAEILRARGDLTGVQEMQERVLAARRRALGEAHLDTLTMMNNLGVTLWVQGDHAGAQEMQERVLAVMVHAFGEEHPETLISMNNLANTLMARGDHAGAQELHERVLARMRRILGEEHPETLTSMNNVAQILRARGDRAAAQELHERVLAARRRLLGDEHSETSRSAWHLLGTLRELQKVEEAKRVLEENLRWLLERDPRMLSGFQREIRSQLAGLVD